MTNTWKADKSHIGRTVVCNDNCEFLTYCKEYEILGVTGDGEYIEVEDDDGDCLQYFTYRFKLKEAEKSKISNHLKLPDNFKIRINNPEHSDLVQKWLFENGYEWKGGESNRPINTDSNFLYVADGKYILQGLCENIFTEEQCQEVAFDLVVVPRVVEEKALQEVEIFGKKYVVKDKEMLENVLKSAGIVEKE